LCHDEAENCTGVDAMAAEDTSKIKKINMTNLFTYVDVNLSSSQVYESYDS
jgi:hypothetical protein